MLIIYIAMLIVNGAKEAAYRRTQARMEHRRTKSKQNLSEREKQRLRAKYRYTVHPHGWTGKYNDIW